MKRLLPYLALLQTVKLQFLGALFCGLVYAATNGFGLAYILKGILPELYGRNELSSWELVLTLGQLPLVFGVRALSGFANSYLIAFCGVRILEELRKNMFGKLQELHLGFFDRRKSGDLLSRVIVDSQILQETIIKISNDIIIQPVTLLGAMAFLLWMALQNKGVGMVLLFLLIVPLCVLPVRYAARKLQLRARQTQKEMGAVTEFVRENLAAAKEVRAFNLEGRQIEGFFSLLRKFSRLQIKVVKYLRSISPSIDFISSVGIAAAIFYAREAGVTLNDVIPAVVALYFAYDPVKRLGVVSGEIKRGLASRDRLEEILREPVLIKDPEDGMVLDKATGKIEFSHASFSYGKPPVLKDINCLLEAGKSYALVGPSGAGKSTFINLVPRFYDLSEGSIKLDGTDLRDIKLASLRRQIALVAQNPVLFNDTIFNNILLSRPGATREAVFEASRKAYAHDFIKDLEEGYETKAGDQGARLSGGQKQRIALARAFLKDAPILILDEATSALDSESESVVHKALETLIKGKTVLIIAHRLSTIRMVDTILIFECGRITDRGRHRELYRRCEFYRKVYDKQQGF